MKSTVLALFAVLAAVGGCASRNTDSPSASPILTSERDCLRDGGTWNAKFAVCEPTRRMR